MAKYWADNKTFAAHNNQKNKTLCSRHVYPSGAGLHVGHPLGYIASDVYSDIKDIKVQCFASMGYDSFGLPAEQYAIQTGQRLRTLV
jgi:leucyl-tRNA synthetase